MQLTVRLAAVLRWPLWCVLWLSLPAPAHAEHMPQGPSGELQVRGNYWRDRNTRVLNPTVEVSRNLPAGLSASAQYTLDAITSASVAAGVTADQPFTELRHEVGFSIGGELSRSVRLTGSYRYSTESDYWSHTAGLRLALSLAQDNTQFLFGGDYSHNIAAKRLGPTGYLLQGTLEVAHLVALWTQVLSPRVLSTLSWETTFSSGYHNNPYRPVFVSNERREWEQLPDFRVRNTAALSLHGMLRLDSAIVPHVTFRPALRVHFDSWGLLAGNPELAVSLALTRHFEVRGLVGYYGQKEASFYRAEGARRNYFQGTPSYDNGPVMFNGQPVYTSDVKLGSFSEGTFELMLRWRLLALSGIPHIGGFLERSMVELTGGMVVADRAVGWQFGIPLVGDDPQSPAGCSLRCGYFYAALGLTVPL